MLLRQRWRRPHALLPLLLLLLVVWATHPLPAAAACAAQRTRMHAD
jgi:hypothetical protein